MTVAVRVILPRRRGGDRAGRATRWSVVKGVRFADLRDAGDPVALAAAYDAAAQTSWCSWT
jgi:hypothetical protein